MLDTNRRLQEFTASGTYVRGLQLGPCDSGVTPDPLARGGLDVGTGAAFDDSIFVAHPCANQLLRLRLSDMQTMATTTLVGGKGVSSQLYETAPSNTLAVYAAQPAANQVANFNRSFLSSGSPKATPSPTDVFIDPYGVLFATDTSHQVIHLYGSDGNEFRTLGSPGSAAGQLNTPTAIDVFAQYSDLAGNLFIADYGNQRIQRWNPYGYTYWTAPADDAAGGGGSAPVNTAAPQITGTPVAGGAVNCTTGTWTGSPTSFAYAWARDGAAIGGATGASYTIAAADIGHNLTCTVTATNASGSGQATAAAVVPVAAAQAPVNQTRPVIGGTAVVGSQLSCSQGTWSNAPTGFAYAWRRDGSAIAGASASTYTVAAADAGHALTCAVTASNAAGATTAVSDPVTPTTGTCASGPVGVSINGGAAFTSSPGVTLTIHEPAGATGVVVSADGGFASPTTFAVACTDQYAWTLTTTGADRLPKTVYVRFTGPGIDGNQTFSDDIILDQTAPAVQSASIAAPSSGRAVASAAAARRYTLRLRATDNASGVKTIQTTGTTTARRFTSHRYGTRIALSSVASVRWVRAIDAAGNVGHWRRVKLVR